MECFLSERTALQHTCRMAKNRTKHISTGLPRALSVLEPLLLYSSCLEPCRSNPVPTALRFFYFPCCNLQSIFLVNLLLVPQPPAHGTWHQPRAPLPISHLIRGATYARLGRVALGQIPSDGIFYLSPYLGVLIGRGRG